MPIDPSGKPVVIITIRKTTSFVRKRDVPPYIPLNSLLSFCRLKDYIHNSKVNDWLTPSKLLRAADLQNVKLYKAIKTIFLRRLSTKEKPTTKVYFLIGHHLNLLYLFNVIYEIPPFEKSS